MVTNSNKLKSISALPQMLEKPPNFSNEKQSYWAMVWAVKYKWEWENGK